MHLFKGLRYNEMTKIGATDKVKKGLLAIWSDVDPGYRVEFQKWHNCEHIRERVAIPGFFVGRRYQGIGTAPHFLMCYETEDSKVLASEPYLHAVNHPSPWTKEVIAHSENIVRGIYRMVSWVGEKELTEAPYLVVLKFNADSGSEKKVLQWYREEQLPRICDIQGVHRGRLYRVDDEISHIRTEERKIHRGGPGRQTLLALYEVASSDVPKSRAWQELDRRPEHTKTMKDVRYESYWLDFVMYAPVNNR
jgi:hypothetical protein